MAKAKKSTMSTSGMKKMNYGGMSKMQSGGSKKFPDLTGDGKVTKADILKGRGVIKKYGGVRKAQMGGSDMTPSNVSTTPSSTDIRTRGAGPANIINALKTNPDVRKLRNENAANRRAYHLEMQKLKNERNKDLMSGLKKKYGGAMKSKKK
jgi:hypothetical protein